MTYVAVLSIAISTFRRILFQIFLQNVNKVGDTKMSGLIL